MASVLEGTPVLFTTNPASPGAIQGKPIPFTAINGTVVDPDTVTFAYQVQGKTKVSYTFTYPTGDPMSMISRQGVGLYSITVPTASQAGNWAYSWACAPGGGTDVTKTQVVWEGEIVVSATSLH